jgi:twitching motility protein PilU
MYTVEQLLGFMKQQDASDLYITVGRPPSFKVSGSVKSAGKASMTTEMIDSLLKSVASPTQIKEFDESRELNLAIYLESIGSRYRFNVYWQKGFPAMVIRKIETEIKTLDDLKLPPVLRDVCMTKRGLVLVVGATGSGKSTTLAAMINHRNMNEAGHIMTIEDPVEFVHEHKQCVISQREVGSDTHSFRAALKNALRQAPTVILIGEIRDEETMEHAINFAETGHLCLATLHSNSANQALERVINFFPPERHRQIYMQLSLNLKAVVSQRLVKSVDGGRAAAIEVLLGTARVRDLMKKADIDGLKEAMGAGGGDGMQSFDMAFYELCKAGRISVQEALANADSATDLKLKFKIAAAKGEIDPQRLSESEEAEGKPNLSLSKDEE